MRNTQIMHNPKKKFWIDRIDEREIVQGNSHSSSLVSSNTVNTNTIQRTSSTQTLNGNALQQPGCRSSLLSLQHAGVIQDPNPLSDPSIRLHEELSAQPESALLHGGLGYDNTAISFARDSSLEPVTDNSLIPGLCQNLYRTFCMRSKTATGSGCYPNLTFCTNNRLLRCIRHRFPDENLFILSAIQLMCGVATIIVSSIALTKAVFLYQLATGMWVGSLMLVTSIQGLIAARRPIVCTLIGLLIFCSLVTVSSCLLICVSVSGIIEDGFMNLPGSVQSSNDDRMIHFSTAFGLKESSATVTSTSHQIPTPVSYTSQKHSVGDFLFSRNHFLRHRRDFNLRACHVILHTLLLLIGILESSVSLATSVICCRSVCSRSGRARSRIADRTNILSFSVSTANQAASYLRATGIDRHVGSGNFLLAVTADSLPDCDTHTIRDNSEGTNAHMSVRDPYVHHTLVPFLSESRSSALIITQAGENALGWAAVRATVNSINRERSSVNPTILCPRSNNDSANTQSRVSELTSNLRRIRSSSTQRSNSSRLFMASLRTPSLNNSDGNNPAGYFVNPNLTELPCAHPGSTLIYVMSSPTREDPPMLFPPFPPPYNDTHRRLSLTSLGSQECPLRHQRRSERPIPQEDHSIRGSSVCNENDPQPGVAHRLLSTLRCTFHRNQTAGLMHRSRRTPASLVLYPGDRLLQPVLIIDDPSAHSDKSNSASRQLISDQLPLPPPTYSPSDPHSF